MSQMMLITEYRTKPGKRRDLFRLFESLVQDHPRPHGQDFVVWSNSATDHEASFLVEYWSEAENFGDLFDASWYPEFISAIDELVKVPPATTVSVPVLVLGAQQ